MKLIELTCRLNGYIRIYVNLNTGEGRKPHEIGVFSINEVPETLNQRSVFYMMAKGDVLNVVISNSDNIEPGER